MVACACAARSTMKGRIAGPVPKPSTNPKIVLDSLSCVDG
jgi:hypothetical protein